MERRPSTDISYGGMLPRVTTPSMAKPTLPRFRWPLQAAAVPTRCGHCGARLIVTDEPTASERLTDLACLMCSRIACELVSDEAPVPMTPEQFAALPIKQGKRWISPGPAVRLVRALADGPLHVEQLMDRLLWRTRRERCTDPRLAPAGLRRPLLAAPT